MNLSRNSSTVLWVALALALAVGILGRGYWTPDEPREADIAWRMSWQGDKAVPVLAGDAFCEKPPLSYWLAGAAIAAIGAGGDTGDTGWIARLPNLLYALVTALAVGAIARRGSGAVAGLAAAAAISTALLSYQVTIWLASDAPLLAAVACALLGLHMGFYARRSGERLRGYTAMHAALALGFLAKSGAGWMVPALTFITLVIWEKRWRELKRWELYAGLSVQAVLILGWVWWVYAGPDGPAHLKVFFWNNLVGRFARVDAPDGLQYADAHRNWPGKYFMELPVYVWPWTLVAAAAVRRAWLQRRESFDQRRPVRFAFAAFVPALCVLSVAATARNIYLAPALTGVALLLGWWAQAVLIRHDTWDLRAVRLTAALLLLSTAVVAAAAAVVAYDAWDTLNAPLRYLVSVAGIAGGAAGSLFAWRATKRGVMLPSAFALLLAYCALLIGPGLQIYGGIDTWNDWARIGRAIERDAAGRSLVLFAADETTRAFIDRYSRTSAVFIPGPVTAAAIERLKMRLSQDSGSVVVTQMPGREPGRVLRALGAIPRFSGLLYTAPAAPAPPWAVASGLHIAHRYALPNGRRYAVLEKDGAPR